MTSEQENKAKSLVGQIATYSIQGAWFTVFEKSKELTKLLEAMDKKGGVNENLSK